MKKLLCIVMMCFMAFAIQASESGQTKKIIVRRPDGTIIEIELSSVDLVSGTKQVKTLYLPNKNLPEPPSVESDEVDGGCKV